MELLLPFNHQMKRDAASSPGGNRRGDGLRGGAWAVSLPESSRAGLGLIRNQPVGSQLVLGCGRSSARATGSWLVLDESLAFEPFLQASLDSLSEFAGLGPLFRGQHLVDFIAEPFLFHK